MSLLITLVFLAALWSPSVSAQGARLLLAQDGAGREPLPVQDERDRYLRWVDKHPASAEHPEPDYHFRDQIHGELAPWVRARPDVVRPFLVGRSVRNRPIWGYVIRDPGHPIHARMLVFACIHALEWISAEVALAFALELAEHPIRGVEVTVIPVLNVDGRLAVEADLLAGRNVYRRGNAEHVDLNRDFAVHHEARSFWRHILPGYHSSSEAPLSQPESQAIDRLARLGRYDLAASLHAFGGWIYLPWSGRWQRPPDYQRLYELGRTMAAAQGRGAYKVLQLSRWGFFFRAQGSELDHLYGEHGIPTVLMECTRSGLSLFRPREWRYYFRWYNPRNPARHLREGRRALAAGLRHSSRDDPS